MRELTEWMGIGLHSLYQAFGDKESLFRVGIWSILRVGGPSMHGGFAFRGDHPRPPPEDPPSRLHRALTINARFEVRDMAT
jgi:hypothetical protein